MHSSDWEYANIGMAKNNENRAARFSTSKNLVLLGKISDDHVIEKFGLLNINHMAAVFYQQ